MFGWAREAAEDMAKIPFDWQCTTDRLIYNCARGPPHLPGPDNFPVSKNSAVENQPKLYIFLWQRSGSIKEKRGIHAAPVCEREAHIRVSTSL